MEGNHLDHQIWTRGKIQHCSLREDDVRGANSSILQFAERRTCSWRERVVFKLLSPESETSSPKNSNQNLLPSNMIHSFSIFSSGFNDHLYFSWSFVNNEMPKKIRSGILNFNPPYLFCFLMKSRDLWMENHPHNLYIMNMLLHGCNDAWIRFRHWNRQLTFLKFEKAWRLDENGWSLIDYSSPHRIARIWMRIWSNLRDFEDLGEFKFLREMRNFESFVIKWFSNPLHWR